MQKYFSMSAILLVSGMTLPGGAHAQQSTAAKAQQSTSTTSQSGSGTTSPQLLPRSQGNLPLTTQKDKASYAMGINVGTNLRRQSVDVDPTVFERGLKDALAGTTPQLTPDEMKATLTELQKEVTQQQQQKLAVEAAANKTDGAAFLAANRTKPGVVTLPSGLQYKILKKGTGPKPTLNDVVVCNYRATLINGKEFDSSYKRGQPAIIPVARLFKGWSEALQLMPVGSNWELYLPPDLAFGDRPIPEAGPDATLVFDVDLLSIKPPVPPANPLSSPFGKPATTPPAAPPPNGTGR